MISIITPSLNQGQFIEKNIRSITEQNYPDFEHIVIDGGSSDATIDILKKYDHIRWISEEDSGQANAINKGFRMAGGDVVSYLNSDDVYMPGTFEKVNRIFLEDPKTDFIFSNCILIDAEDNMVGFFKGKDPQQFSVVTHTNFIPQPTVFFKRSIFEKTGFLNEEYHMSMDFDYWRRISKNHHMKYVNDVFASFREHGEAKTQKYTSRFRQESKISFFKNGGSIFTPYYFEAFIKPKLLKTFVYNILTKKLFFRNR